MIAFTGGEPFLLGRDLVDCVAEAAKLGVRVRIVTSAHWAVNDEIASRRLDELAKAGLHELSISWDDFHEEFVDFSNVRRAFSIARRLGLTAAISIVQGESSKWTAARVRDEIGTPLAPTDIVLESPLNQTGRALERLADAGRRPERHLGPCPYVLSGPTLSAKRKLLACCGVIPETNELVIDPRPESSGIAESIEVAKKSVLLNWLYLRGPYAIVDYIAKTYGVQVPPEEAVGGNCEACRILFESPSLTRHLRRAVEEKAEHISAELELLKSLNLLDGEGVMGLWRSGRTCVDTEIRQ